jgi:hypothetical protein
LPLPVLLVIPERETPADGQAAKIFDLSHRALLWPVHAMGKGKRFLLPEHLVNALTMGEIRAVFECGVLAEADAEDFSLGISNNGDALGEALAGRKQTCPGDFLRDFRDVFTARFADWRKFSIALNAAFLPAVRVPENLPAAIPWIRLDFSPRLLHDSEGAISERKSTELQARVETVLALFCKIQDWT